MNADRLPLADRKPAPPWRRYLPLAILVAVSLVVWSTGLHRHLTLDALADRREPLIALVAANPVPVGAGFALAYAATIAVGLPIAVLLTLSGGFLFGTATGGTLSVVGATIGAIGVFLAARTAIGDALARRAGPRLKIFEAGFRRDAFSYLLVLRLVPLFPFGLVNIVSAVLGVPLRTYAAATAIGMVPGAFVYASVGAGLGAVIDRGGEPDLGILFTPPVLLPILGLSALALLPIVVRRFRRKDVA
jgi:uncharacterized membrane protein YdjX (TVP38/TMEM64 family)